MTQYKYNTATYCRESEKLITELGERIVYLRGLLRKCLPILDYWDVYAPKFLHQLREEIRKELNG